MTAFEVRPIAEPINDHVRRTLTDPIYGHPVPVSVAGPDGYGPCRACLRTFTPGERRILFLYNPFSAEQHSDFAGPVFIHDTPCESYEHPATFPPTLRRLPLLLKAYDAQQHLVAEQMPAADAIEAAITGLFADPTVAVIHVRNHEAKCFIARIERGGAQ
jgi:hypothetical protein